jgi:type IV pilus assembly protein PilQ
MTLTRGIALIATIAAAGALAQTPTAANSRAPGSAVRLKAISSRVHSKGASLVIETTEPVAYVASQPDPLTVLLDFRNVDSSGVTNRVTGTVNSPITGVTVEPAESPSEPGSRVRIELAQPVGHRVRSERNTIVVDFDKPSPRPVSHVPAAGSALEAAPVATVGLGQAETTTVDPIAALGLGGAPATAVVTSPGRPVAPALQTAGSATIQPPAAPAPQQGTIIGTGQPAERKYTGHPVSLDFQGADLRAVLRTFAEISGLNIVIDPKVNGTVDVALRDVPWDQALDIILKANGLGYVVDGTIVRIAPLEALRAEQDKIRELEKSQTDAGQLTVVTHQLSYAKGEDIVALLKAANILSSRGTAFVDARTNTLIVKDLPGNLANTTQLLTTLDTPQPQVEIEARIVQANKNYSRALGIQWGFNGRVDPALGNTTPLAFPNNGNLGGRLGAQGPTPGSSTNGTVPTAVNLGVPAASSAVGLALGAVNGAFNLDVALTALETSGNGRILSTPRVTTQNNIAAEMTQGTQIPIQTVANNTVTVTFKDAALSLKVTPQITAAGTVIMTISLENSQADFSRAINGVPPIDTQRANTTVLVTDGQTTVIGGVYLTREQMTNDKTPGLGNIPLLRWLFKRDTNVTSDQELLIFITPRIIKA